MWLLILSIVLLLLSVFFGAYLTSAYITRSRLRQNAVNASFVLFIAGIVALFIAANWKIGLAGIAGYWLLLIPLQKFWYKHFISRE